MFLFDYAPCMEHNWYFLLLVSNSGGALLYRTAAREQCSHVLKVWICLDVS